VYKIIDDDISEFELGVNFNQFVLFFSTEAVSLKEIIRKAALE